MIEKNAWWFLLFEWNICPVAWSINWLGVTLVTLDLCKGSILLSTELQGKVLLC